MATITHQVFNQVPPLLDDNLFDSDLVLREALVRDGAGADTAALSALGARLGGGEVRAMGMLANREAPRLRAFDANGYRIDSVDFHPAWHALIALLREQGVHCSAWSDPSPGGHVARAAAFFLHGQIEAGSLCPTTMTFAAIPVLQREPALFATISRQLFSREYDADDRPLDAKRSAMIGMGMTEKQGGSDVRSNTTTARALARPGRGERYALTGHKWFFSAPMCDAHLVLARTDDALSCFYVPRWREDGTRNGVHLQRLKDKVGNRSNASSEVEFDDAEGILVGDPGRGINTIIEMASYTRLDCVLGSAALMRQALVQALHHASNRQAFGKRLIEQPLMTNVLADVALESEAATTLALRLARACERAQSDPLERALWRIITPAAKFWVCKRAIDVTGECMEVLGGNGYVEEGPLARLYREAPVNSIWEGSGNVMCLDVLRALRREPDAAEALWAYLGDAHAGDGCAMSAIARAHRLTVAGDEFVARDLARVLVLLVQSALLKYSAPLSVAEGFVGSRLRDSAHGRDAFGMLDSAMPVASILQRAWQPLRR
ncbi:isovaleryl-CoA dehydrogenase [Uliginosibacterium sp. sgz301328]|uniref:isovaleryl-CoA dehydrogenase n=1 Tax=Uliginosibacterium sp. sgz301328 TaxID=3243764 RepID=UPI00359D46F4